MGAIWIAALSGIAFVAFVVALGVALAWGADDRAELGRVTRTNCLQIEALKAAQRADALESYAGLEESLRIYGITLTREIREAAILRRDSRLRRFGPSDC